MEKYKNDLNKEVYRGVNTDTPFSDLEFHKVKGGIDIQYALHTNLGTLTVLDRMTGFGSGYRDIETGYRAKDGEFWLASGNNDVRRSGSTTISEAIEWVKERANACNPDRK